MTWWEEIRPHLLKVLGRYTVSLGHDVRADLEQDLACLAWKNRPQFSDVNHLRRWLMQRARWRALDTIRSNKRVQKLLSEWQVEKKTFSEFQPEELNSLQVIMNTVESLPAQQREVILGGLKGKSENQLALELNVSKATVRSLRRFGRIKLYSLLSEKEEDHGDHSYSL